MSGIYSDKFREYLIPLALFMWVHSVSGLAYNVRN